jgi:hypothetical protein
MIGVYRVSRCRQGREREISREPMAAPACRGEVRFRAMIKRGFNAASACSCISTHSHHRWSCHNWWAGETGWKSSMMTCSVMATAQRAPCHTQSEREVGGCERGKLGGACRWVAQPEPQARSIESANLRDNRAASIDWGNSGDSGTGDRSDVNT